MTNRVTLSPSLTGLKNQDIAVIDIISDDDDDDVSITMFDDIIYCENDDVGKAAPTGSRDSTAFSVLKHSGRIAVRAATTGKSLSVNYDPVHILTATARSVYTNCRGPASNSEIIEFDEGEIAKGEVHNFVLTF